MAEETPLFKVTIDNETIEVPAGTTILQAARMIGKEVAPPAMCYYGKLENTGGNCRTCLVEVSKGSVVSGASMKTELNKSQAQSARDLELQKIKRKMII